MPTGVMNALGMGMITITMKKLEKISALVMVVRGMKIGRRASNGRMNRMNDLISRQALMKEFSDFVRASNNSDFARTPTWNDAVSLVGSMPSAQPERKKGCKIVKGTGHYGYCACDQCGKPVHPEDRFCSKCGADFREEDA